MTRTVRVAVIGSGLAGLTAAYRLSKTPRLEDVEFEVHLFDKASSLGMDSHSISVDIPGYDEEYRVDVPMRSFQGGYYPQVIALYKHLGVQFRQQDYTYSFSTLFQPSGTDSTSRQQQREIITTLIYNGASGRQGVGIPSTFFHPPGSDPTFRTSVFSIYETMLYNLRAYTTVTASTLLLFGLYFWLLYHSLPIQLTVPKSFTVVSVSGATIRFPFPQSLLSFIPRRPAPETTLRAWTEMTTPRSSLAKRLGLDEKWKEFVSGVVVLLFSAVCTTPEEMVWDMPVGEVLDYVYNTFGTHHYVAQNGVRDVAKRLTNWIPSKNVHLSTSIASISLSPAATPVPAPNLPPATTPDTPPPTTPAPVTTPGRVPPRPAPIPVPVAVPESSPDSSTPTTEPTSPTTPQQPSQDQEPVKKKRTVDIHCADGQVYEGFDHIIFATQANQAVPLLTSYLNSFAAPPVTPATPATPEQPTTQEEASTPPAEDDQHEEKEELRIHSTYVQSQISCLSQFTYCPTIVINHTDSTLLPSNNQDWRDLNLVVSSAAPSEAPTTTTPETPAEGGQEKAGIMGEEGSKGGDGDGRMVLPTTYTMVTHVLPPPADYTHTHTQTPSQPQQPSAPAPAPAQPAVTLHTQMRTQEKVKSFPQIYQTTNPIIAPKLENVLSVAHLERAVVDVKAKRALKGLWRERWDTTPLAVNEDEQTTLDEDQSNNPGLRWGTAGSDGGVLGPLQGAGKVLAVPPESDAKVQISEKNVIQDVPGIWLCGSYAHAGIPLLEGCVVSARNVVEQGIWTAEGLDSSKVEKLW